MTKKPIDLRNDPKFKARVAKLEGSKHAKVLREPLKLSRDGIEYYVLCIGQNDSYLIMDMHCGTFSHDCVYRSSWTKDNSGSPRSNIHDLAANVVTNWLMLTANDSDFVNVKHSDVDIFKLSIDAVKKLRGEEFVKRLGETYNCFIQGTFRENIKNPYHT